MLDATKGEPQEDKKLRDTLIFSIINLFITYSTVWKMLYKTQCHPGNFKNVSVDVHPLTTRLLTQSLCPATSHVGPYNIFTSHNHIYSCKAYICSGLIITTCWFTESQGQMYAINRLLSEVIIFKILKKDKMRICKYITNKTRLVKRKKKSFWHQNNENFGQREKQTHTHTHGHGQTLTLAPELLY